MKVFITKFKGADSKPCNYFQANQATVYLDDFVMPKMLTFGYPDFNEENLIEDTPQKFTSSDFEIVMSLLLNIRSRSGKTLSEFFAPETDNYIPVGYKVCWGIDENFITHSGFIDIESIYVNERKDGDSSGQTCGFRVIGPEEQYIQHAEKFNAPEISYDLPTFYSLWMNGLIANTQVFKKITFSNGTFFRFNQAGLNPVISNYIHNRWIQEVDDKTRWTVFSSFTKEHGMMYNMSHPVNVIPNTLQNFTLRAFFPSDALGNAPVPKINRDADKLKSISLKFAKEHLGFFYVSYTSPQLPSQDWFGGLYLSRNESTTSFSDISGYGLVQGNQTNMFFADYDNFNGWVIRNNIGIRLKDMIQANQRAFLATFQGVNIGASIGRSLVKSWQFLNVEPRYIDAGFNQIVSMTAMRELKYLVSGRKKAYELDIYYPEGSPHRLMRKFTMNGTGWLIHKVSKVDTQAQRAVIKVFEA